MARTVRLIAIIVLVTNLLSGSLDALAAVREPAWHIADGQVVVVCPMTVGGSFEIKTEALDGDLSPSPANAMALDGAVRVDLATLKTGIGLRDRHLRERYLEIQRGDGFSHATLSEIALPVPVATAAGRTTFTGALTVHGVTRPIDGTVVLTRAGDAVRVEATFPVTLPDYAIAKPRYLGIGVRDEVRVTVKLTARSPTTSEQP